MTELTITHLWKLPNRLKGSLIQSTCKSLETLGSVDLAGLVAPKGLVQGSIGGAILELDDVLAWNGLAWRPGLDEGCPFLYSLTRRTSEDSGREKG